MCYQTASLCLSRVCTPRQVFGESSTAQLGGVSLSDTSTTSWNKSRELGARLKPPPFSVSILPVCNLADKI
eukprot:g30696.t1